MSIVPVVKNAFQFLCPVTQGKLTGNKFAPQCVVFLFFCVFFSFLSAIYLHDNLVTPLTKSRFSILSTHLKRLSTLDSSWVVSAGLNGLAAHNSPSWLGLYLSVCKLLDLALALPAQQLPQFQMYQWAFVSEGSENNNFARENNTMSGVNGLHFYQVFATQFLKIQTLIIEFLGLCSLRCSRGQVALD